MDSTRCEAWAARCSPATAAVGQAGARGGELLVDLLAGGAAGAGVSDLQTAQVGAVEVCEVDGGGLWVGDLRVRD